MRRSVTTRIGVMLLVLVLVLVLIPNPWEEPPGRPPPPATDGLLDGSPPGPVVAVPGLCIQRAMDEIGARKIWELSDAEGYGLTGRGVVICDIDAGIDRFHPMFFKADGGVFAWIDSDHSGGWSPGDAVDIDGDGVAEPDESLGWLPLTGVDLPGRDTTQVHAGYDFLYRDMNGNGRRDFGPPAFTEGDPCYGEQVYLVDDRDRDDRLDPGEALIGLGTSKIRAIHTGSRVYRRGLDLIHARAPAFAFHGTAVCGIAAGGWTRWHRLSGVAPEAEILLYTRNSEEGLFWAREEGADIVLHEYDGVISDGRTKLDQLVDEISEGGMIFVAPAGNKRGTTRHVLLEPGEEAAFEVSERWLLGVLCMWEGQGPPTIRLRRPNLGARDFMVEADGLSHRYEWDDVSVVAGNLNNEYASSMTTYSFGFPREMAYRPTVLHGIWEISFPGYDRPVHIYSGGVPEFGLVHEDGKYTVISPGSADSAITVGAYDNDAMGRIAWFSGSGPRWDGFPVIDIAAPGVHVVVPTGPPAGFSSLGGTSLSAPFVAGAAALLRQAFPEMGSGEFRGFLTQGAAVDSLTTDRDLWGAGRLRIRSTLAAALRHYAGNAGPAPLALHAAPNPSSGSMSIRWESIGAPVAEVRVFTASGRLVWSVVAAPSGGLVTSVPWDGRDDRGIPVPAGIYFAHVREGTRIGMTRCVRLR